MAALAEHVQASARATLCLTAICGLAFPAAIWTIARLMPARAHGSLMSIDGAPRGSVVIGQTFTSPHYFHARPSAAGPGGYDATSSGGSNLPPSSPQLQDAIRKRARDYRAVNGLDPDALVPADALTASASGLDPHISPENAAAQTARVARARGMKPEDVAALAGTVTETATLGVLGRPRVNVLLLNLALDRVRPVVGTAPSGDQHHEP